MESSLAFLLMLPHVCLSMFGEKLYVGSKLASPLSQSLCGNVFICWDKTPRIDMLCWIKAAPASVVLCNFLSAAMRACSCSFVTMAGSVRSKLKLGISEDRCLRLTNFAPWPRCLGVSADAADAGRIVATFCVRL